MKMYGRTYSLAYEKNKHVRDIIPCMWGAPKIYLDSFFNSMIAIRHVFFGENPVCTNVPVKQSDRDCRRVVQAGIPSPDTSHPGVYNAL